MTRSLLRGHLQLTMHRLCAVFVLLIADFCSSSDVLNPFDDSVRYDVHWGPLQDVSLLDKLDPEPMYIRSKNNERYACRVPIEEPKEKVETGEEEDSSVTAAHVLAPLVGKQKCVQDAQSYWTYEYCFGAKLRQFHIDVVEGVRKVTAEYILGRELATTDGNSGSSQAESIPKKRIGDHDFPYYSLTVHDGTPCDLSGTPRMAEVIFICLNDVVQTRLISVKETQTCEYEAIVAVPELCSIPAYRLPKEKIHSIYCSPADGAPAKPLTLVEGRQSNAQAEFVHMEIDGTDKLVFLRRGTQAAQPTAAVQPDQPSESVAFLGDTPNNDGQAAGTASQGATGGTTGTSPHLAAPLSPDKGMVRQFLSGRFCLDGGTGWWLYELCYGKHVLQYHKEPNSRKRVEILLGKWDEKVHSQWLASKAGKKKKGSYYYSNGDVCDLTKKPRSVTVRMRCKSGDFHPSQVVMSLQEPSTCNYVLTVESPIFCDLLESADENGKLTMPEP